MAKDCIGWQLRDRRVVPGSRSLVMGILNVTPDSFSDGGRFDNVDTALTQARRMVEEGADLIDVGGESTRPGAAAVGVDEELARTIPVVEALCAEWDGLVSIDTSKARVAEAALAAGAAVVNDVSGLRADSRMVEVCRAARAGVIVMHMQGQPRTMQHDPSYDDVVEEVRAFFQERFSTLSEAGIEPECLCFDPGIGFGKTLEHNLALLAGLDRLVVSGRPLVIGLSRKSFIGKLLGDDHPGLREWPTVALTAATRARGALIHRVHAVRENREALRMLEAVLAVG